MGKTPEYTKKAIKEYNERHDRIQLTLPKGIKDRIIKATGSKTASPFMVAAIVEALEKVEHENGTGCPF